MVVVVLVLVLRCTRIFIPNLPYKLKVFTLLFSVYLAFFRVVCYLHFLFLYRTFHHQLDKFLQSVGKNLCMRSSFFLMKIHIRIINTGSAVRYTFRYVRTYAVEILHLINPKPNDISIVVCE